MLTKEEVVKKFGDVELKFCRYYKYSFYYKCFELTGMYRFEASFGGSSEDIYKSEVTPQEAIKVSSFEWEFSDLKIYDGEELVFEWEDDTY